LLGIPPQTEHLPEAISGTWTLYVHRTLLKAVLILGVMTEGMTGVGTGMTAEIEGGVDGDGAEVGGEDMMMVDTTVRTIGTVIEVEVDMMMTLGHAVGGAAEVDMEAHTVEIDMIVGVEGAVGEEAGMVHLLLLAL
jgi:hypothetical protein